MIQERCGAAPILIRKQALLAFSVVSPVRILPREKFSLFSFMRIKVVFDWRLFLRCLLLLLFLVAKNVDELLNWIWLLLLLLWLRLGPALLAQQAS